MVSPEELDRPSDVVRARMKTQRRSDTKPELALRRALYAEGLRYRVGYPVPGFPRRSIDIAFPGRRVAVFVDGCYWHRCPEHHIPAKNNGIWWRVKLQKNLDRDRETDRALESAGWTVIRVWEHERAQSAMQNISAVLER